MPEPGGWDSHVSIPAACRTNCPVILGGVACDGFVRGMQVGTITHFHQDHIGGLRRMMGGCRRILVHPITFGALAVLDRTVAYRASFQTAEYGTDIPIPGGTVRLLPAGHIPGSCQVLVEHDGKRLLYSGDFDYPGADPPECDYLVLDATHGDPSYERTADRGQIMGQMIARVAASASEGGSTVVTAARGTLQEIMEYFGSHLDMLPDNAEFISSRTESDMHGAIYGSGGPGNRRVLDILSAEARDAMYGSHPCILFTSSMRIDSDTAGWFRVQAGRFGPTVGRPAVQDVDGGIRCDLSSHADYRGILEYVQSADPEFVLVDSSRSGSAEYLAASIRDILHIDAEASGHNKSKDSQVPRD